MTEARATVIDQLEVLLSAATAAVGPCACADKYGPVAPYCENHAAKQRALQHYDKLLFANATVLLRIAKAAREVVIWRGSDAALFLLIYKDLRAAIDALKIEELPPLDLATLKSAQDQNREQFARDQLELDRLRDQNEELTGRLKEAQAERDGWHANYEERGRLLAAARVRIAELERTRVEAQGA